MGEAQLRSRRGLGAGGVQERFGTRLVGRGKGKRGGRCGVGLGGGQLTPVMKALKIKCCKAAGAQARRLRLGRAHGNTCTGCRGRSRKGGQELPEWHVALPSARTVVRLKLGKNCLAKLFGPAFSCAAGVYSADLRKHYDLADPSWKYDIMPEIADGHNVLDFVDPDIDAKLAELEREEAELEVGGGEEGSSNANLW